MHFSYYFLRVTPKRIMIRSVQMRICGSELMQFRNGNEKHNMRSHDKIHKLLMKWFIASSKFLKCGATPSIKRNIYNKKRNSALFIFDFRQFDLIYQSTQNSPPNHKRSLWLIFKKNIEIQIFEKLYRYKINKNIYFSKII